MFQPIRDIPAHVVKHPRYTGFAVVLAIDVVENFTDLFQGQTFGVQDPRKAFTLFFLITEYNQDIRMKVTVPVTWNAESQCTFMPICPTGTIAVALVACKPSS